MKWALVAVAVMVVIALLVVGSLVGTYNDLVGKREAVSAQVGQIQNVLQRRADLIPNLVQVVKGYAAHEQDTLTAVMEARANATRPQINITDPDSVGNFIRAQEQFSSAIARLMVVVERYPDLKANEQFNRLMDEVSGTENRISVERKRYNDTSREFNTRVGRFPAAFFAGAMGFKPFPYFEASAEAQEAPKIEF
jgi:LemA protein